MKLNKIEKLKLNLSPKEFYDRLEKIDPKNLTDADIFYLKNFGIYTTKQHPDKFMLRIRIPAGRIEKKSLKAIAQKSYRRKVLITARAQIEIHGLDFKEALKTHKELLGYGLTTLATLTDNIRNIVTDPMDGYGKESIIEVYPIIKEMEKIALDMDNLGMLPRKFNAAISGNRKNVVSFFTNDCYFALAKRGEEYGFRLFLGGKNSAFAKDTGLFIKKEQVVDVFGAIIEAYKKYGPRGSRNRARLFHFIEEIGLEGFLEKMKEFYPDGLESGGEVLTGKYLTKIGGVRIHETRFGEVEPEELERLSKDEGEIRLGADQNIYTLFPKGDSAYKRGFLTVCAGSRYCIYSLFDTKEEAARVENLLKGLVVGYSGCLKGCGRHIACDIGFVGIRTNAYGRVERGVRLFLGGEYTFGEKPARQIYWAVPLRKLSLVLGSIMDDFKKSGFKDFEEYSKNVLNRFSAEFLGYYFLAKIYANGKTALKGIKEEDDIFALGFENFQEAVKELEKRLYSCE